MKPFDLNAALDGAKLVTTDGNPARLICADRKHQAGFIWLEQDEKGPEYVATGTYEALCQALRLADDEPVKQAQTPRPHAELIHAWADGAEIEVFYPKAQEWTHVTTPAWDASAKYRIKPKEWYENIPERGRLCWVKASSVEPLHPAILIAAAPDLLEALESVIADLKLRAEVDSRGYRVLNISDGVLLRAGKAIAKAIGKSHE